MLGGIEGFFDIQEYSNHKQVMFKTRSISLTPIASWATVLNLTTSESIAAGNLILAKRNPSYSLRCYLNPAVRLKQEWLNRLSLGLRMVVLAMAEVVNGFLQLESPISIPGYGRCDKW